MQGQQSNQRTQTAKRGARVADKRGAKHQSFEPRRGGSRKQDRKRAGEGFAKQDKVLVFWQLGADTAFQLRITQRRMRGVIDEQQLEPALQRGHQRLEQPGCAIHSRE